MQKEMTAMANTLKNMGFQVMIPNRDGINYFYVSNNTVVLYVEYVSYYREYKVCVEYKSNGQGTGCVVKDKCKSYDELINSILEIMETVKTKENLKLYNFCVDVRKVNYLIGNLNEMKSTMRRQDEFEITE